MIVGHDVTVGRDDEARAERLAFTILRLAVLLAATAVEHALERRASERVAAGLNLDTLTRRDIDHGRLQLFGQIGETFGRPGTRHNARDLGIVVLGDLRSGRKPGEGEGSATC